MRVMHFGEEVMNSVKSILELDGIRIMKNS